MKENINGTGKKKMSGKSKAVFIVLLVAAVCLFSFSLYQIISISSANKAKDDYYSDLEALVSAPKSNANIVTEKFQRTLAASIAFEGEDDEEETEKNDNPVIGLAPAAIDDTKTDNSSSADETEPSERMTAFCNIRYASMNWNFDALKNLTEDAVGWLYQDGTVISYPLVQADNNEKYMRHLINMEYSIAGTPFVDYRFEDGLEGRYSFIYGHNMDDKSMFGSLTNYKNEEYYKEHPEFELYIGDDAYVYYVYAAFQPEVDSFLFNFDLTEDEDFFELMEMAREQNQYEMRPIQITKNSIVTVLTTCIDYPRNYDYRYCVVLVRGPQLIDRSLAPEEK